MRGLKSKYTFEKHPIEDRLSDDRIILVNFWIVYIIVILSVKEDFHIHMYEWALSFNILFFLMSINYLWFPKFFLKGRIWLFLLITFLSICFFGIVEELIIERLLYNEKAYPISPPHKVFLQYLPFTAMFILIKLMIYYRDKQIIIDNLSREKTESQLQFLKSQINPHILFNNLNNIYSLAIQKDSRTPETIIKLANLMRYVVYESSENYALLSKELRYLEDYLELQKIQVEGRGMVNCTIKGNSSGYVIAPLLLIPFVENAFKHSMDTQIDNIEIVIDIAIQNNLLVFKAKNNYDKSSKKGISPKGIGLKNTKQRLNLLYPEKHKLEIKSSATQYEVNLEIELI